MEQLPKNLEYLRDTIEHICSLPVEDQDAEMNPDLLDAEMNPDLLDAVDTVLRQKLSGKSKEEAEACITEDIESLTALSNSNQTNGQSPIHTLTGYFFGLQLYADIEEFITLTATER